MMESSKYHSDLNSKDWQKFWASILTGLAYATLALQASFIVWGVILLMEFSQTSPRLFAGLYVILDLFLVSLWTGAHAHFVSSYDPVTRSTEQLKVTSTDLARIRSTLAAMWLSIVLVGITILAFLIIYPGDVAHHTPPEGITLRGTPEGDGHAVRDKMDTASPYYTIWLGIVYVIIATGVYLASNILYTVTVYTEKFLKGSFKSKGN